MTRRSAQPSGSATTVLLASVVFVPIIAVLMSWSLLAHSSSPPSQPAGQRLFTPEELLPYNGKDGKPIYIAILGDIFDVSTGRKHYATGQGYAHFAGRDGSRSFATGESEADGLTDDVKGLKWDELEAIADWHKFYVDHETYTPVGKVVGRHYDASGVRNAEGGFPWDALRLRRSVAKERRQALPDCNSRWSSDKGSEVWCTSKSGGIERDWVGVPRIYSPALDVIVLAAESATGQAEGSETGAINLPERCACVTMQDAARKPPHLRAYEGCEPKATTCKVPTKTSS